MEEPTNFCQMTEFTMKLDQDSEKDGIECITNSTLPAAKNCSKVVFDTSKPKVYKFLYEASSNATVEFNKIQTETFVINVKNNCEV